MDGDATHTGRASTGSAPTGSAPTDSAPTDIELRGGILDLLARREVGKTICPSEVVRSLRPGNWREHMPAVREAAAELADEGAIDVLQKGEVVDVRTARGPVRLRSASDSGGRSRAVR